MWSTATLRLATAHMEFWARAWGAAVETSVASSLPKAAPVQSSGFAVNTDPQGIFESTIARFSVHDGGKIVVFFDQNEMFIGRGSLEADGRTVFRDTHYTVVGETPPLKAASIRTSGAVADLKADS